MTSFLFQHQCGHSHGISCGGCRSCGKWKIVFAVCFSGRNRKAWRNSGPQGNVSGNCPNCLLIRYLWNPSVLLVRTYINKPWSYHAFRTLSWTPFFYSLLIPFWPISMVFEGFGKSLKFKADLRWPPFWKQEEFLTSNDAVKSRCVPQRKHFELSISTLKDSLP